MTGTGVRADVRTGALMPSGERRAPTLEFLRDARGDVRFRLRRNKNGRTR